MTLQARLETILGKPPRQIRSLGGGCVSEVYQLELSGGDRLVAKFESGGNGKLDLEAYMLDYLREHSSLPVPRVEYASPDLLLMEWMRGDTGCRRAAEKHAAALLLSLHEVRAESFGLERDTLIGGLDQSNVQGCSWLTFFAEQRLLDMGRQAVAAGRLPAASLAQLEVLAGKLDQWLDEPDAPRLLHGDLWAGNILSSGDRVTGIIDPAIYYGHPEIELAFMGLFGSFGPGFFDAYGAGRGTDADFEELRKPLYNLYPLLVHARLFGGGYVDDVQRVLDRYA